MTDPFTSLDAARTAWLSGDRDAWSLYALCTAQLRALDPAGPSARPALRPRPALPVDRPVPASRVRT